MSNNSDWSEERRKFLASRREYWTERYYAAGSFDKLSKETGVNPRYLHGFIQHSQVPINKKVREFMGLDFPSRGAWLYRIDSEKAQEQGWKNAAEFRRWARGGRVQYPKKP